MMAAVPRTGAVSVLKKYLLGKVIEGDSMQSHNETPRVAQEAINASRKHPDHLKLLIMTIFPFLL